jgi:hypothetical protein
MEVVSKYKTQAVPLELTYNNISYKGLAVPVTKSCSNEVCWELEVTLNSENLGRIHYTTQGWKMDFVRDQGLVDAIGERIKLWYE